ncbi:MAG: CHAT domain-containing protein [Candidatus Omnitrophica bacterium]|nr:CHAT domain-containing protein [Candidatus Omnitrophota bacterium]
METAHPLVLEVTRTQNMLKMALFDQSDFASTLRHFSQARVSFGHVDSLCGDIVDILNKAGRPDTALLQKLKKTGGLLWDQLLSRQVKERLKAADPCDLLLSIDEELISIPWELFYDGADFLCLKFNIGRLLRTRHTEPQPQFRSVSSRLRMLILANPTDDLKSAYAEGLAIRNTFDGRRNTLSIDFKSTSIDTLYVKKNLSEYDIVHYAGHCEYDNSDPQNSGWVLSDGRFSGRDIATMAESLPMPSLVFSNACHSAQEAETAVSADYQEKTYGLASAFLYAGVRHYIGAIHRVEDPVSFAYARQFYQILRRGRSVGEAARQSRVRLARLYGIESLRWASYLLYGDPGFALFRKPGARADSRSKETPSLPWYAEYRSALIGAGCFIFVMIVIASLYAWLPSINPSAYMRLRQARAELAKGRTGQAAVIAAKVLIQEPRMRLALPIMAEAHSRMGRREEALQNYFDYALASGRARDPKGVAYGYSMAGWMYQQMGNYAKAREFYEKALDESRANRDPLNEALAMRKLAVWHMDKEENDAALELLTKSAEINRERQSNPEHRYNLACDYFDLGLVFENKDDRETAREFYVKSQRLFERMNRRGELSDYYFNLGEMHLMEKDYVKALECYNEGLRIDTAQNNLPSMAQDYAMIGELYMDMDNFERAEEYLKKSLELSRDIKARPEFADASYQLGLLYKKRGWKNRAREYLRQAQEFYVSVDYPGYEEIKEILLSLD